MKKIGITGASGFIGSKIVSYYLDNQFEVTVLTRDKSKFKNHPNLKIITSDLISIEEITIQKFLVQLDVLFYLASEINNEKNIDAVNVKAFEKILKNLNSSTHLIYLSSIGIFDFEKNQEIFENSDRKPKNLYEKSKLNAEKIVEKYQVKKNIKASILRPSTVIGSQMKSKILDVLIKFSNSLFTIKIKENVIGNFILIEDVIQALILIESNSHSIGENYNLSRDISLKVFISYLNNSNKIQFKVPNFVFENILKLLVFFNIHKNSFRFFTNTVSINTSKIKNELGFEYQNDYKFFIKDYTQKRL
jgi:nucleoside-diphosphate-sugar epimerase